MTELGLMVPPVKGAKEAAEDIRKIGHAAEETGKKFEGGFSKLGESLSKNMTLISTLLRSFGPVGEEAAEVAEKMELMNRAFEKMGGTSAKAVAGQEALARAFAEGKIGVASHEAALARLTRAQQNHAQTLGVLKQAEIDKNAASNISQGLLRAITDQTLKVTEAQKAQALASKAVFASFGTGSKGTTAALWEAETRAIKATATEELKLKEIRAASAAVMPQYQATVMGMTTARTAETAAAKEQAEALKLVNVSSAASAGGFSLMPLIIGTVITALVALGAAIYGAHKAWELLKDSVKEASEAQKQAFPLRVLIGDTRLAEQEVKKLHELFEESVGLSFGDMADAAKTLTLMGVGTEHLIERVKQLGVVAVATGESLSGEVSAYSRVRMAIERGTMIEMRGIGAQSAGVMAIFRALEDATGKTEPEIQKMFKEHKISIEMVNKALEDATSGTGRFALAMTAYGRTMAGALDILGTKWKVIKEALGEPVVDALAPLILSIGNALDSLKPIAAELGERVAAIVDAFRRVGEEKGWQEAIKTAWEGLMTSITSIIAAGVAAAFQAPFKAAGRTIREQWASDVKAFKDMYAEVRKSGGSESDAISAAIAGIFNAAYHDVTNKSLAKGQESGEAVAKGITAAEPAVKTAGEHLLQTFADLVNPFSDFTFHFTLETEDAQKQIAALFKPLEDMNSLGKDLAGNFVSGIKAELDASKVTIQEKVLDVFKPPELGSMFKDLAVGGAARPFTPGPVATKDTKSGFMGGGAVHESDWEKQKSDLKIINDFWYQRSLIESQVATTEERARRIEELRISTSKELYDPKRFADAIGKWNAFQREKELRALEADRRIMAGDASMFESMSRGIQKVIDGWGNMQQQASNAAGQIMQVMVDGISSGLVEILTGTKSVADGFRDMAIDIIKSIEAIIIKLLIQITIQRIAASFGYQIPIGASGGGRVGTIGTPGVPTVGATTGFASGGRVGFANGSFDDSTPPPAEYFDDWFSRYAARQPDRSMGGFPSAPTSYGGGMNLSFNQSGQVSGGFAGPQGSIYGINPNTGNPILNANAVGGGGGPSGYGSVATGFTGPSMSVGGWGSGLQHQITFHTYAPGGRIAGPPSRSDTIPAWLSTGEVVINAAAVARMDARMGRGWENRVNRFASGGRAGGNEWGSGGGNVNINIPISVSTPGGTGGDQKKKGPSEASLTDLKRQVHGIVSEWASKEMRHGGMLTQ